jgi:hypothetical protein
MVARTDLMRGRGEKINQLNDSFKVWSYHPSNLMLLSD